MLFNFATYRYYRGRLAIDQRVLFATGVAFVCLNNWIIYCNPGLNAYDWRMHTSDISMTQDQDVSTCRLCHHNTDPNSLNIFDDTVQFCKDVSIAEVSKSLWSVQVSGPFIIHGKSAWITSPPTVRSQRMFVGAHLLKVSGDPRRGIRAAKRNAGAGTVPAGAAEGDD